MLSLVLYLLSLWGIAVIGVMAAISDWRGMTIPNHYPLIILGLFPVAYAAAYFGGNDLIFSEVTSHLTAAGTVFAATLLLYFAIRFGAGDSKLMTAYAIWFTPSLLIPFLFYMTVIGFFLALGALIMKRFPEGRLSKEGDSWPARIARGENAVPYGIAISGGAIVAFLSQGYVAPSALQCFLQTSCL